MRNSGDRGRLRRYQPGSARRSSFHCHRHKKFGPAKKSKGKKIIEKQNAFIVSETLRIVCITEKETGSDSDIAVRVKYSTYFILAHSSGDKLWGAGRKPRRLGDGIRGGRCAAAIGILQGFVWFFHI